MDAHLAFLALPKVSIQGLQELVSALEPGAVLRDRPGLNVRVGSHFPPPGGPEIRAALERLLAANLGAWERHVEYETLHPFTDGNGRSGRALWLYDMGDRVPLGFLHTFYYQSLSGNR